MPDTLADRIVGRRRELDALGAFLAATWQGSGRLVLCSGESGIGKTRLAQELAGLALAQGTGVAWGRCVEAEGAPAFWPWRQVLRSLGVDADRILPRAVDSPEDRFRVVDETAQAVVRKAVGLGLVVVLDDIQWADEPSLLVLRQIADLVGPSPLFVFATFRHTEPAAALRAVLPDLLRSPSCERLELRGFDLAEVREQLAQVAEGSSRVDAGAVLDITAGNPLFVREVARAMAEGTWRPDRPPRSVVEMVRVRMERVSPECRQFLQAAAVVGRDFPVTVVARAVARSVRDCLPLIDEAESFGLVDRARTGGEARFVHALTREAVEASLTTAERLGLHRAVAEAIEAEFAADLPDHVAELAHHWAELAPYGEAATARTWAVRAAEEAVRRLAYEEGVRLYHLALNVPAPALSGAEQCRLLVALGRAASLAGDVKGCLRAAVEASESARASASPELLAEAALVLEAVPEPAVNTVAKQLCEEALGGLGEDGHQALRARLLAQRSHLAFYDGDQEATERLSDAALELARQSRDDRALVDALHARKEACPGPVGRPARSGLASEMLALAQRTGSGRTAMWGELWLIDTLVESGRLSAAEDELAALEVAVRRVGGPVSRWHFDRATAYVAQAQGRYADAQAAAVRAFHGMRVVEPGPARGTHIALRAALAAHIGLPEDVLELARTAFDPLPRFRTMAPLTRSVLLLAAGLPDEAAASYQQAGPIENWSLPAFFVLPGYVYGTLAAAELGRHDDVAVLLARLQPFGGEHVVGEAVFYLGPVELALGRGAAALGNLDAAVDDLSVAVAQADRAGARGFAAEARYHLATTLARRARQRDFAQALAAARDADRLVRALGMSAYTERARALVARLGDNRQPSALSQREVEVAQLVAEGLTNRQIAERLVISERTAQNHVQHILTKLGFSARSQIAAWIAETSR